MLQWISNVINKTKAMGESLINKVKSRIKALNDFNRREEIRKNIALYFLLILMVMFVIGEVKEIMTPRVVFIENVSANTSVDSVNENFTDSPVVEDESSDIKLEEGGKSQESTIQLIRKVAKEENFNNVDGLIRLAHCESRFNRWAYNPTNNSHDRGAFQISKRWHPTVTDEQAYNVEWATKWTIDKIEKGGLKMWMCAHAYNDNNYKLN